jgi:hypothetical protein
MTMISPTIGVGTRWAERQAGLALEESLYTDRQPICDRTTKWTGTFDWSSYRFHILSVKKQRGPVMDEGESHKGGFVYAGRIVDWWRRKQWRSSSSVESSVRWIQSCGKSSVGPFEMQGTNEVFCNYASDERHGKFDFRHGLLMS